jgi:type III pantothenate kinase
MYLIGDIGNTETKICLFNNKKKLLNKKIFNTNNLKKKNIKKNLRLINLHHKKIDKILFSSVVPNVFKNIKRFIKQNFRKETKELKQVNLNKIIKVDVNMKQVGSDRLANALSVINGKDNFIILDFGTATTFDVVLKNRYKGGIIAPGVNLSLQTLVEKAKLIPHTKLTKIKNIVGKNTQSAVRSGFYWGYQGLIENIINLIKRKNKTNFKIIFTGGLSHLYKDVLKNKIKVDRDLTIKGLLRLIDLV